MHKAKFLLGSSSTYKVLWTAAITESRTTLWKDGLDWIDEIILTSEYPFSIEITNPDLGARWIKKSKEISRLTIFAKQMLLNRLVTELRGLKLENDEYLEIYDSSDETEDNRYGQFTCPEEAIDALKEITERPDPESYLDFWTMVKPPFYKIQKCQCPRCTEKGKNPGFKCREWINSGYDLEIQNPSRNCYTCGDLKNCPFHFSNT